VRSLSRWQAGGRAQRCLTVATQGGTPATATATATTFCGYRGITLSFAIFCQVPGASVDGSASVPNETRQSEVTWLPSAAKDAPDLVVGTAGNCDAGEVAFTGGPMQAGMRFAFLQGVQVKNGGPMAVAQDKCRRWQLKRALQGRMVGARNGGTRMGEPV